MLDKMDTLNKLMIDFLEPYDKKKKEEGFIPTVEMLIEELKSNK